MQKHKKKHQLIIMSIDVWAEWQNNALWWCSDVFVLLRCCYIYTSTLHSTKNGFQLMCRGRVEQMVGSQQRVKWAVLLNVGVGHMHFINYPWCVRKAGGTQIEALSENDWGTVLCRTSATCSSWSTQRAWGITNEAMQNQPRGAQQIAQ